MANHLKKFNLIILLVSYLLIILCGVSHAGSDNTIIIPLVKYYVIADANTAIFLKEYCNKTEVKYEIISDGRIKAGPFLSGYEANWLTSLTAHASTVEEDDFTATNIENVDSLKLLYSDAEKISGKTWALLTPRFQQALIKAIDPDTEQPAFYLLSKGYFLGIATHPWVDFYQDSFGLACIDSPGSPIFIQIISGARGTGYKSELCRIWYFDRDQHLKILLYEFQASEFSELVEGYITFFTCLRLSADKNTLAVQYYHLRGNIKHDRGDGSIKAGRDKSNSNINVLEKVEIRKGRHKAYPISQAAIKNKKL